MHDKHLTDKTPEYGRSGTLTAMRQATIVFPAIHPPMTGGSLKADGRSIVMMRECAPHMIATLHVVPQSIGK
jgi:hypothetical protein